MSNIKREEVAPTVSVIIPTYNRPAQTLRAVQSVEVQSYCDFELLLVDDGSEPALDEGVLGGLENAHLLRLDSNSGVAAARNAGIAAARGEWIAFLDSDDIWHPEKLAAQMAFLADHPHYRIVQTQEQWLRNGVKVNQPKKWQKRSGMIFKHALERCAISPSSVVMQRSLFDEVGLFNEQLPACEDYDLWLRITPRYAVGLVDRVLMTRHGGHGDQLSTTVVAQDLFRIESLCSLLQTELDMSQRRAVRANLQRRVKIVAQGLQKRGKTGEAAQLLDLLPQE